MTNVTDTPSTQPLPLSPGQLQDILHLGLQAHDSIVAAAAQGKTAPVGVWRGMYDYIFALIANNKDISDGQEYWFQGARFITSNQQ